MAQDAAFNHCLCCFVTLRNCRLVKVENSFLPLFHSVRYDAFTWSPCDMVILIAFASKLGSIIISSEAPLKLPKALFPFNFDVPSATLRVDLSCVVVTFKGNSVNTRSALNGNSTADKLKCSPMRAVGVFSQPFVIATDMTWSKTREVEPNITGNHSYTTTCRRIGWKG